MFYYFFSSFSHPDKNVYKYYIYVNPTLSILFHFSIPIIFLYTDKNMYKYILISFYFLSFFYDLFSLSRQYKKYAQIHLNLFLFSIFLLCSLFSILTNKYAQIHLDFSIFYHFSMLFFLYPINFLSCDDKKYVQIHLDFFLLSIIFLCSFFSIMTKNVYKYIETFRL